MNAPKPFNSADFGALYTALEFMMSVQLAHIPPDALHTGAMLLDKVRQHFIAAGGNPKELEE